MRMWWFIWWIHKVESWWGRRVLRDGGMRRSQWCCSNASLGERASSSFSRRKANICSRSICPKENTTLLCGLLKQLKFSLLRKLLGFSNGLPAFARIYTKTGRKTKHRLWRRLRDAALSCSNPILPKNMYRLLLRVSCWRGRGMAVNSMRWRMKDSSDILWCAAS